MTLLSLSLICRFFSFASLRSRSPVNRSSNNIFSLSLIVAPLTELSLSLICRSFFSFRNRPLIRAVILTIDPNNKNNHNNNNSSSSSSGSSSSSSMCLYAIYKYVYIYTLVMLITDRGPSGFRPVRGALSAACYISLSLYLSLSLYIYIYTYVYIYIYMYTYIYIYIHIYPWDSQGCASSR